MFYNIKGYDICLYFYKQSQIKPFHIMNNPDNDRIVLLKNSLAFLSHHLCRSYRMIRILNGMNRKLIDENRQLRAALKKRAQNTLNKISYLPVLYETTVFTFTYGGVVCCCLCAG